MKNLEARPTFVKVMNEYISPWARPENLDIGTICGGNLYIVAQFF